MSTKNLLMRSLSYSRVNFRLEKQSFHKKKVFNERILKIDECKLINRVQFLILFQKLMK